MSVLATSGEVIGTALTVSGLVASWLRFMPEHRKTAAELWRENAEAWEARVKALEAAVSQLTAENVVLRSVVSGAEAIKALAQIVEHNHAEVMAALRGKGEGD